MLALLSLVLTTSLLVGSALSAETFWGRCPVVTPMKAFDMERFEGLWYVVESFDSGEKCKTWNISKGDHIGTWKVLEKMESGTFVTWGFEHQDFNTAVLTTPYRDIPAQMRVFWPISAVAGDGLFTVHKTDYVNYAGIFECQNVGFLSRQSGIVLSRKPLLEAHFHPDAKIVNDDIKEEHYRRVLHNNCDYRRLQAKNTLSAGLYYEYFDD